MAPPAVAEGSSGGEATIPSPPADSHPESPSTERSWWRWRWRSAPTMIIGQPSSTATPSPTTSTTTDTAASSKEASRRVDEPGGAELTGWERIKALYDGNSMEKDILVRSTRMVFFASFVLGGMTGFKAASETYEIAHKGRKYLSPSDAFKRRMDYAIVRFAKAGFPMGAKAAFITGSIVLLTTHTAAYRNKFAAWYFPAASGALAGSLHAAAVGGVFMFPAGLRGVAAAGVLGIVSGLTLSSVVCLYALGMDRSVDSAYWHFKKEHERMMWEDGAHMRRVAEIMKEHNCWKYEAERILKEEEAAGLEHHDD